jgi:hypothetical protein
MGLHFGQWVEVAAAAIGALVTLFGLVYTAGRFSENVKANTRATDKLSDVIDVHMTWSAEMVRESAEKFHDHDKRITVLEEMAGSKYTLPRY